MNVLICDDMQNNTAELTALLDNSGFNINAAVFHSGEAALAHFRSGAAIDVCILDIVMPEMSGIELSRRLRGEGYAGEIVFLSTSREFAPESYEVKAFSYLLKPPEQERVNAVLSELLAARQKEDVGSIVLKSSGSVRPVLFRDISYVEVMGHEVFFHLINGSKVAVYATFAEIAAELLSDPRFMQCHRSFIVNMSDIAEIDRGEVVMNGGARIAISRSYQGVKKRYFQWEFGGGAK